MFKKLLTISFLLAFASLALAQNTMLIKPNGETIKLKKAGDLKEAIKVTKITNFKGVQAQSVFTPMSIDAVGKMDTVNYRDLGGTWNVNFGFTGQDIMFTYYEAKADMTIKGIGYTCSDDEGSANANVGLRIIKLNWTLDQLKAFPDATYQGYYPSDGDGYNNADAFGEEASGNWIAGDENHPLPPWTDNADPGANTWDYDLWSDGGFAWPTKAVASPFDAPVYNWLMLNDTGLGEVDVKAGEVFAVVALHDGSTLDGDRIGFWSDNTIGVPCWKYYENGRISSDQPGWWVRMYTWDFVVAVDITGDTPPEISNVTKLPTTLSTDARTVEATIIDENPGGGEAGVASANLLYTINGGDEVSVAMTANGDVYSADIPGQQPGTEVTYTIEATDVGGNYTKWASSVTYTIFKVENPNALLVFNGMESPTGYPQSYYFGVGDFVTYSVLGWDHDSWAYGALTQELVDNYDNIVEIATGGPADINSDVIATWLSGNAARNYMLAGDEWLGGVYGWDGSVDIPDGDFAKDVLGVSKYIPDINYAASGDQELPSVVNAVQGSLLGGQLYDLHQQISSDSGWTVPIVYDPFYEIGASNWLDGAEFLSDVEVDLTGIGVDGNTYNIAGHRTLSAGNKVAFLLYDPLSLDSHDTTGAQYWWYGFTAEAPQVRALYWFDAVVVGVDEEPNTLPEAYTLSQNYPNPFNPTTVISFTVPEKSDVTLKVYNLLGQEVATLVDGVKNVGKYDVNFNASSLSSGVYFYTIKAGQFTSTRKMMLIK